MRLLRSIPILLLATICALADSDVQGVVMVIRHGVRAPIESEIRGSVYNRKPWASWPVAPGILTDHGAAALNLLGRYYRTRYSHLLSDCYVEANSTQRTISSADALLAGLSPDCNSAVHTRPPGQINPLFNPAHPDLIDTQKLAAAILGRMGNNPGWFQQAFAAPLAEMENVLGNGSADFRTTPSNIFPIKGPDLVKINSPVSMGADFAEHFLLEYTEGMPMSQVGWGRVPRSTLDQLMEMNTRFHDFVLRTPYFAQVAGSDLAARVLTLLRSRRFAVLVGHDSNLTWLGGLLHLDWLLPDGTFNATPPGSALVFELHRGNFIRVYFVSQTLDGIRNLSRNDPVVVPVFVPGCSVADDACSFQQFQTLVKSAIDPRFVEP